MIPALKRTLKRLSRPFRPAKTVMFEGMVMRGAIEDYGFLKALARGQREPYTVALFKEQLRADDLVIDVGAHLGHFSLLAAQGIGQGGRVIAFEPHPRNYQYLQENSLKNGFAERISVLPYLVSSERRELTFYVDDFQSDCSSIVPGAGSGTARRTTVQAVHLDSVINPSRLPAVVKIDVEGAELQVLKGMAATLELLKKGNHRFTMFIECNPEALSRSGASAVQLVEALHGFGLRVDRINEDLRTVMPVSAASASALTGCDNFICRW